MEKKEDSLISAIKLMLDDKELLAFNRGIAEGRKQMREEFEKIARSIK